MSGFVFELAHRAAEYKADRERRRQKDHKDLPKWIAERWQLKRDEVLKDAEKGDTTITVWISLPEANKGSQINVDAFAKALPAELKKMLDDGQLEVRSADSTNMFKIELYFPELTDELLGKMLAKDEEEAEAERATKRMKRHAGDEGDF